MEGVTLILHRGEISFSKIQIFWYDIKVRSLSQTLKSLWKMTRQKGAYRILSPRKCKNIIWLNQIKKHLFLTKMDFSHWIELTKACQENILTWQWIVIILTKLDYFIVYNQTRHCAFAKKSFLHFPFHLCGTGDIMESAERLTVIGCKRAWNW